jgi:hypothetical protein
MNKLTDYQQAKYLEALDAVHKWGISKISDAAISSHLTQLCAQIGDNEELEKLRIQLAGCGVCAMQNTFDSVKERITKDSPYWSASYGDVCRAVDAEIRFRGEYEDACKTLALMHAAAVGEVAGPKRGVIEDIADLKSERDQLKEENERLHKAFERYKAGYIAAMQLNEDLNK